MLFTSVSFTLHGTSCDCADQLIMLPFLYPAAATVVDKPPNILFLMCDSMDGRVVDPTSPVSKYVRTPNLDRLAAEGVNFVRTYAASPQCVPSRTSMLAGRRTDQIRAFSNGNGLAGDPTGKIDAKCLRYYDEEVCADWATTQRVNTTFFDALAPVYGSGGDSPEGDDCTLCIMGKVVRYQADFATRDLSACAVLLS